MSVCLSFAMALCLIFPLLLLQSQDTLCLLPPHDPMLSAIAAKVSAKELQDPKFQEILDQMLQFARGEQGNPFKSVLVGLAGPQVGIGKRIILVDVQADGKGQTGQLNVYINPEIAWASPQLETWYEGCYSAPGMTGIVLRSSEVIIEALDRNGQPIVEKHAGYIARIFQHEIDHLNGVRFPMRVTQPNQLHEVDSHEMYHYRNEQGWRNWSKTYSWERWLSLINKDHPII